MVNIPRIAPLFLIFFCSTILLGKLTTKEKTFIAKHSVSDKKTILVLNKLFGNLDQKLLDLFDGKPIKQTQDELIQLFKKAGFIVHNLRAQQINEKKSDQWPARVVLTHKDLPQYFFKIGFDNSFTRKSISRIVLADLINALISDPTYKLTTIGKIEKKLFHRPNQPDDLIDKNYIILSPKVNGKPPKKSPEGDLSFDDSEEKHYRDFLFLMEALHYEDPASENLIINKKGKLVFIDTEILLPDFYKLLLKQVLGW